MSDLKCGQEQDRMDRSEGAGSNWEPSGKRIEQRYC